MAFSKLPTWWIREEGLKWFTGGPNTGTCIAALKCLMALSMTIDFHTRRTSMSYSDLEKVTGLSRPMVARAIPMLEKFKVVKVYRDEHTHCYKLTNSASDDYWAKLPVDRIRKHMKDIPNRGITVLYALKIYMLMLSKRPNDSLALGLGYEKIVEETGIQKSRIRAALNILYNHDLIHVDKREDGEYASNFYTIRGLALRARAA